MTRNMRWRSNCLLQRALAQPFTLLPVMLVEQSAAIVERLGHALADVLRGRNALIVASSDLSHYYPQDLANRLDRYMLGRVAAFDPSGVLEAEEHQQGFACGRGPLPPPCGPPATWEPTRPACCTTPPPVT